MSETSTTTTTSSESRPSSMTDALSSVEVSPSSETTAVSGDAPATVAPAAATQDQGSVSHETDARKTGPVPLDVHTKALENARTKEAERVRAEIEQQYQWTKAIPETRREAVTTFLRQYDADPVGTLMNELRNVGGSPQYAAQVRSELARLLGARTPAADPEPAPDLDAGNGMLIYSASQQKAWQEWNTRQLTSTLTKQFEEKLQPLQDRAKAMELSERNAAYSTSVTQVLASMKKADPEFEKHMPAIAELIQGDPRLRKMAVEQEYPDPQTAIELAWSRIYRERVLPERNKTAEASWLASQQTRAVASTTNPATATTATPKRPRSMTEALTQQGA